MKLVGIVVTLSVLAVSAVAEPMQSLYCHLFEIEAATDDRLDRHVIRTLCNPTPSSVLLA